MSYDIEKTIDKFGEDVGLSFFVDNFLRMSQTNEYCITAM